MQKNPVQKNRKKQSYTSPELVHFGSIVGVTGHCLCGEYLDSVIHPDRYKPIEPN